MLMWFRKRKISTQILLGFAIVVILTAAMGIIGIMAVNSLGQNTDMMYNENTVAVIKVGQIDSTFRQIAIDVRDMVTADDVATINTLADAIKASETSLDTLITELDPLLTDEASRASFDAFVASRAAYAENLRGAINLARTNADQTALLLIQGQLKTAADTELAAIQQLTEAIRTDSANAAAESAAVSQASMLIMVIAAAVVIVLALIIGIVLSRILADLIGRALQMIRELSKGHLGTRLGFKGKSEIAQMAIAMDGLADYLENTVIGSMQKIAAGDVDIALQAADEGDQVTPAIQDTVSAINTTLASILHLQHSVVSGNMRERASLEGLEGRWLELTQGLNQIIDEISAPISEASMVMSMMADGNLKIRVTGDYKGDHDEFVKEPLNRSISAISSYVNEISQVLTNMANNNLDQGITNVYPGDFAPIQTGLNLIIYYFNRVLLDMKVAADQVTAGARQVSDGSQALSMGTTTQASSIQQLTASLAEIAAQTKQNALNANEANTLALSTRQNAIVGNERMKEMQKAMEEINISSTNISKIIKVIDDIAFQTNILALNAAVEAARAGVHGKGFAVVAEEVRNLAARSAKAASETTALIEGSIKKVALGTSIADETAAALDKIVNDIARSATLVGDIAKASNDQATGIAQINQGVDQVSIVVQSNSATAEQSAAASEELAGQAELLRQMISRFKLSQQVVEMAKNEQLGEVDKVLKQAATASSNAAQTQDREKMISDYQRKMTEKAQTRMTDISKKAAPSDTAKPASKPAPAAAHHETPPPVKNTTDAHKAPKTALSDVDFDKF